ncbi:hypothetical protein F2Q68_00016709 [Brassica cretica]|uniref:Uncharacterized protein n=1 Tax=Brassica cretica TaxID=69181 RepID=A0A8S9HMN1_BRACR|nr:hypothetical protein F2Q68_00016709 [Brassica cretica]
MVAIIILIQDENGNMYDQDGHLRNATSQKLDAQGNVIHVADATGAAQHVEEAAPPKALADYNRPDESLNEYSSELTIRGRYEEDTIDRCTSSVVDRYRREASTIED